MEINYNSYIKDLPQLNPNRSLFTAPTSTPFMPYSSTTGDPFASDEAADDQPSARKVKLLCSFGGKILPRPSDGALRYAGGHTRIIAVRRDTTLLELYRKMADAYGGPVAIRYQLPDEDLDALVSVSSTEDLDNMMDEYDKLAEGSADGSAKLRVFLFSQTEVASILNENFSSGPTLTDPCDRGHKYIEAVNGDAGSEANNFAGETRVKGSTASASSTHNPDLGFDGFNKEGTSLPLPSPAAEASTFLDPSKMAFVGTATPVPLRETQGFPSSSTFLGQTMVARHPLSQSQSMLYPSQAFVESHKVPSSPQSLNMATSLPMGNIVSAPQGTYLPPMTMPPSSMPSQVGLNPVQVKVDPFSNEDQYIGTFTQAVSNPNYNIFQQPLFQIPLQSSHLHLVAPPPNGPRLRFEDCQLCQKALPHVHSDMLINELGTVSGNSMPKTRPMLQSHHSDDIASLHGHHRVASFTRMESLVEPKVEHPVNPDKNDIWGVNKVLDSGLDSDKFFMQITEKNDLPNLVQPVGTTGFSGDTQVSFGVTGNSAQFHFEGKFHQQQKQTLLDETFQPVKFVHPTNTFGLSGNVNSNGFYLSPSNLNADYSQILHPSGTVGVLSTGEASYVAPLSTLLPHNDEFFQQQQVLNALDPLSQTKDYAKQVDGITEALNVNTFDILRSKGQLNPTVEPESLFVGGEDHLLRPQNGGNVLFSSNAFLSSTVRSEGISAGPVNPSFLNSGHSMAGEDNNIVRSNRGGNKPPLSDAFVSPELPQKEYPMNPLLTTTMDLNLFELGNTSQASMKIASSAYTQNIERNVMPLFSNQQVPGLSSYIAGSAFTNSITGGTSLAWSDAVFQPQYLNSDISNPQCGTTPFPLWSSKVLVHDKHFEETFSSDSLLGKENCQEIIESKNTSNENQFSKVDVPDIEILLEEGALLRADWLIKESQPASVVATKDFIKQDRPYVAKLDGESAFIPLSSVPSVNGSKELNPSFLRGAGLSEEISSSHSATVLGDPRIEDVKAKQSDKLHMGIPTAKDIGRLQIIKNCDLEELRELGSGTFGTVYHGKWRGSDVAIKRINDRCFTGKPSEQEKMRGDFWNEASKLADLHHPNVVAFYGVVLDGPGGSFSTVTEYMVNGSLRSALQKNDKTFDRRKRLIIAMDVAFGMEYLHGRNIVHFDLKSDNLLVNLRDPQRPICKVGDLGLSKVKCQTLISGGVRGTLPWMAPELLNGSSNLVSDKVDVFSFGIVMWELLTGEEPYSDLHYGTIIGGIVSNTLRPPVPENCDPEWRALMEQCWSADPSLRPNFTEIANTLRAMASSLPQRGKPPK